LELKVPLIQPLEQKAILTRTFTYYAVFVALGLCVALFGPTLPNLAANIGVNLGTISTVFVVNSIGRLIGSLLCGRLLDQNFGHRILVVGFGLLGIGLFGVPLAQSLLLLMAAFFVLGIGENLIDVAANTLLVWTHGAKAGVWMNGLHFTFGLGGVASPLLAATLTAQTGSIQAVYWLVAAITVPFALWLTRVANPTRHTSTAHIEQTGPNWKLVGLIAAFFFAAVGAEVIMLSWTFTYAVKAGFDESTTAAALTSAYWAAYSIGRLLSIPIALRVHARYVLMADLVGALIGAAILLLGGTDPTVIWVGVLLIGLSLASVFPTMLTFTGELVSVSGKVNGVLFAVSNVSAMFFPWFIGQLFEPLGTLALPVLVMGVLVIGAGVMAAIVLMPRRGPTQ
jgi:FHS family Na+ dependent glucose MFS transporter 1